AKSSIDRIIDGLVAGGSVRVFSDRTVSPTFAIDAAAAIVRLLEVGAPAGLYHCVNSGWTTWAGLGAEILTLTGARGAVDPVPMASIPMAVRRPLYCALSNAKLASAGMGMPSWQDALRRHLASRGLLART
ncbi:MAG: sugar nucleotide-binding protein, partial [Acidobacteriota bacterium]|nr:sugar nucleotide-binding protein [Acidobacteriota bacterium]